MNEKIFCSLSDETRAHHEREFKKRFKDYPLLDAIDHPSGVRKGDIVVVRNINGFLVGPYKVLGFEYDRRGEARVFLDWDCFWFPTWVDKIVENRKGGVQ